MEFLIPETLPSLITPTGRFVLEPFTENDAGDLANLLLNPVIYRNGYGSGDPKPCTLNEAMAQVRNKFQAYKLFTIRDMHALRHQSSFIGTAGIEPESEPEPKLVRTGRKMIHPDHWGMKVNHEVMFTILEWLYGLGVQKIECNVNPMNFASIKSLKSFGFVFENMIQKPSRSVAGEWRDVAVLSLMLDEWESIKERNLVTLSEWTTSSSQTAGGF